MAKCAVCLSKKGKRKCARKDDAEICSLCCGQTRTAEECEGCSFYQAPKRDYITIPYYTPEEMDGVLEREDISEVIESEICTLDSEHEFTLSDEHARRIIELILDEYYFNVSDLHKDSDPIINGVRPKLDVKKVIL